MLIYTDICAYLGIMKTAVYTVTDLSGSFQAQIVDTFLNY